MHLVIEGIDVVFTPQTEEHKATWHRLNIPPEDNGKLILADGSNIKKALCPMIECKMKADFEGVEIAEIPEELRESINLEDWKIIMADCRKGVSGNVIPVHIPKKGYQIHQNELLFDAMVKAAKVVLGDNHYEIATVGTLGGYSQFFVSIAIKGMESITIGSNDIWKQYFNLIASHNGLVSSAVMLAFIRMVCMNTVKAAIANADSNGTSRNIKHTKNSLALITPEKFAEDLKGWVKASDEMKLTLEAIKAQPMDLQGFKSFAAGVFTSEKSDAISTTSANRVGELESLFSRGLGNTGESRYDAVNAFTEYFTSGNGVGRSGKVNNNKRLASANFGRGNDWKREAIRIASSDELTVETIARGEILLNDYNTAKAAKN